MRLGIGGGAFGFRGGISTRGIGVGFGPFSAGTSWRGRRSRGGGGSGVGWLILAGIVLFLALWPYLLGTFIAVQCGAWNPSTTRFVVGWCFETVYVAVLAAAYVAVRYDRSIKAAEEARRMAQLIASGEVYQIQQERSTVYRHGTCTVNHRSPGTAERCGKSLAPATGVFGTDVASPPPLNRSDFAWSAAILVVGLVIALVVFLADPIHTPAGDAAAKPCPTQSATSRAVTMPGLVGQNAGAVEHQLKALGLASIELASANPNYKSVWVPSNWTVVSTDPAPGCVIGSFYPVTIFVTK